MDGPPEIDLDKLIGDNLYLDNQGPRRRQPHARPRFRHTQHPAASLYQRRSPAPREPRRARRQHAFVMLPAPASPTPLRGTGLRSLDQIELLLLQVTRKNEARGYERFRDLFEAIVAYNE